VAELPATIPLTPEHAGRSVEAVLAAALGASEPFALRLLRQERVLLAGRALRRGDPLPGDGALEVLEPLPGLGPRPPRPDARVAIEVRHEDPHLVVLEKPAGVAMHPGPQHGAGTLLNGLVARFPELLDLGGEHGFGLAHRLDRDTSGLLVVARTAAAHDGLVQAFTARAVEKRYRALLKGAPREPSGTIDAAVDGREAVSRFEVVDRVGARRWVVALALLHPLTGRKHQLRIHLAGLGCPILGDKRHGPESIPIARQLGLRRVALHAERLAFAHPVTGERLAFDSPFPPELERAWRHARTAAPQK
jgi:23S rRNA pseudouridine1911/1915/1917 synthase